MRTYSGLCVALCAFVSACSPTVRKCAKDTLFVDVELADEVIGADQLIVAIAVNSAAPKSTPIAHTPGKASGGVVVEFPAGYPAGDNVEVTVTATLKGVVLGVGTATIKLSGACEQTKIAIGKGSAPDLAVPVDLVGADLAGADLTIDVPDLTEIVVVEDLAGADLAGADLVTVDLVSPTQADMTPSRVENCFNGIDDDGDGMADCADPDCTTGTTPKAECVPSTTGAPEYGTWLEAVGATCPTAYTSTIALGQNFVPTDCGSGSCSCGSQTITGKCQVTLIDFQGENGCSCSGGGCTSQTIDSTQGCVNLTTVSPAHHHTVNPPQFLPTSFCSGPTGGTPVTTPAKFGDNTSFCSAGAGTTGCSGSQLCVPAAASNCILLEEGSTTCPSSYSLNKGVFYLGKTDAACSCGCTTNKPDACSGTWTIHSGASCSGSAITPSYDCDTTSLAGYVSTKVNAPTATASCGPYSYTTSTPAAKTPRTVCCRP